MKQNMEEKVKEKKVQAEKGKQENKNKQQQNKNIQQENKSKQQEEGKKANEDTRKDKKSASSQNVSEEDILTKYNSLIQYIDKNGKDFNVWYLVRLTFYFESFT
jgi:hypothetical protein